MAQVASARQEAQRQGAPEDQVELRGRVELERPAHLDCQAELEDQSDLEGQAAQASNSNQTAPMAARVGFRGFRGLVYLT